MTSASATTLERDLLETPLVGALLRRRGWQLAARGALLALAIVMVLQGLYGSQLAPKNLSTLLTWVHYRGFLVLALLLVGNVFCTACPIVLVRDLGRKIVRPFLSWPRALRNKWIAIGLFVGVLYAYELLDLWGDPWATAWLVLGYFGAALLVDVLFRGASFCKFLCPVGQFNFVSSTVSPVEVAVKDRTVCDTCSGNECLRGAPATPSTPARRGCELGIFLPKKVGNLDCTLCLDCVHACPEENVTLTTRTPGLELADPTSRSGVGPLQSRT
ncbi:MAG: 4Fe-4S binding protein, partial [Planctomycetota bacterium JB042]